MKKLPTTFGRTPEEAVMKMLDHPFFTPACPQCGAKLTTQPEDTPPRWFCTTCEYVAPKG